MKTIAKQSLIALVLLLGVIQFVRPSRTNPSVDPAREIGAVHPVTPAVNSVLQRACNDCHSNRTVWPWYSNVAPASWMIARDVWNGRSALNLSDWRSYDAEKNQELLRKMCEETRDREMPMSQYALVHPGARLSHTDVQALCSWTREVGPKTTLAEDDD
jgi:hypothetical protein